MMNFICSYGLEYLDLLHQRKVRWLSSAFFFFMCEVLTQGQDRIFLKEKNHLQILISNTEWLWKLIFASDLIILMNLTKF